MVSLGIWFMEYKYKRNQPPAESIPNNAKWCTKNSLTLFSHTFLYYVFIFVNSFRTAASATALIKKKEKKKKPKWKWKE